MAKRLELSTSIEDVSSTSIAIGIAIKAAKKKIEQFKENCWRSQQYQCACSFVLVELEYIIHKTSAVVPTTETTRKRREEIQIRAAQDQYSYFLQSIIKANSRETLLRVGRTLDKPNGSPMVESQHAQS
jgi:hypothetical protein